MLFILYEEIKEMELVGHKECAVRWKPIGDWLIIKILKFSRVNGGFLLTE